jgi:hypothetical protein
MKRILPPIAAAVLVAMPAGAYAAPAHVETAYTSPSLEITYY